jgi:hypothetical protein
MTRESSVNTIADSRNVEASFTNITQKINDKERGHGRTSINHTFDFIIIIIIMYLFYFLVC